MSQSQKWLGLGTVALGLCVNTLRLREKLQEEQRGNNSSELDKVPAQYTPHTSLNTASELGLTEGFALTYGTIALFSFAFSVRARTHRSESQP